MSSPVASVHIRHQLHGAAGTLLLHQLLFWCSVDTPVSCPVDAAERQLPDEEVGATHTLVSISCYSLIIWLVACLVMLLAYAVLHVREWRTCNIQQ